jgi:GTPase
MFEYINKCMPKQKRECCNGNREYKIYLDIEKEKDENWKFKCNKPKDFVDNLKQIKIVTKINKRASQLRYRLEEGCGKALYMIGVTDGGNTDGINIDTLFKSINFLYKMAEIVNAKVKTIKIYKGGVEGKYICSARIDIPDYTSTQLPNID